MSENWSVVNRRYVLGGGVTDAADMQALKDIGVTSVLSAAVELDDTALCVPDDMDFFHIPWQDDGQPKPLSDFLAALDWAVNDDDTGVAMRKRLPKVYIHCAAGVNRGPTLCTFLMVALSGVDLDVTWAQIKTARPQVNGLNVAAYRQSVLDALEMVWQPATK